MLAKWNENRYIIYVHNDDIHIPRTVLTCLFGYKPTKLRSTYYWKKGLLHLFTSSRYMLWVKNTGYPTKPVGNRRNEANLWLLKVFLSVKKSANGFAWPLSALPARASKEKDSKSEANR